MGATCGVTRPNGYPCINPKASGRWTCAAHDPNRWCGERTTSGTSCRRMRVKGQDACSYHLDAPVTGPRCTDQTDRCIRPLEEVCPLHG